MKKISASDLHKYTLGTWMFGGDKDRNPNNDDQRDIEAIKMHIRNGVNQIFSAQNYAAGWAERLVGQAVKDHDRSKLLLSTAIKKEDSSYDDMLRSIEESLERMGLDYIDIVVHHAPIPEVPITESIKALNAIVDKGLARAMAVSNYNSKSMTEALASTKHPILFNQVYYNLFIREIEDDGVLKLCQDNNVLIQAYRPLEIGEFESLDSGILKEMAEKYSLTNSQMALAWLTSQGAIVVATTHDEEHLLQNLKAVDTQIENDDIERLRREFPIKHPDKVWIR
jgi:diketogulonate reductase-like aldo/keto reductase